MRSSWHGWRAHDACDNICQHGHITKAGMAKGGLADGFCLVSGSVPKYRVIGSRPLETIFIPSDMLEKTR